MNFDKYINKLPIIAIMTAITSDPNPPEIWSNLMNNLFVRFILLYILTYEAVSDHTMSLNTTIGVMIFFYLISSNEERKNYLSGNFDLDKINIFKNILN